MKKKYKSFIATLFISGGNAVKSIGNKEIISEDPVALAKSYSESNVDRLLIFDLSKNDAEHEETIGIIKEICTEIEIPVLAAGNINRFEDVKKILYAGCAKAVLNYAKESNIEMTKEVSDRFGADNIVVALTSSSQYTDNRELLLNYASELVIMQESCTKEMLKLAELPMMIPLADIPLERLIDYLEKEYIGGIFGTVVNSNIDNIKSVKALCKERGILTYGFDAAIEWNQLKLGENGLVPCIVQDYKTGDVLMMAYMNEIAFNETIITGKMHYFSRSRQSQWLKGETSGHFQYVKELYADCDNDTLLAKVAQVGVPCHTGAKTCFFNEILTRDYDNTNPLKVFEDVFNVILDRKVNPKEGSYTNYLFDKGIDKILKKLGEEATEIVIAAKNPNPEEVKYEISDFLYHMMVLMAEKEVSWEDITTELANR